ncbi:MAG: AAA family ATPase [Methanosarcinaceae archaeon]|nr:AAA family ATPase [Methanosarcinaceae archaeon]
MIISFSVQNFRSVKEEQTLSFEAAKNKDYEEYMVINAGKYRLLKMIALFGNNASGKTNILIAMTCLRELAINTRERGVLLPAEPFGFDEQSRRDNCRLSAVFLVRTEDVFKKYRYSVEFNRQVITREKLDQYMSSQPALVYSRETVRDGSAYKTSVRFGRSVRLSQAEKDAILINTLENMTVLSSFRKINVSFSEAKCVFDWFREGVIDPVSPKTQIKISATEYFSKNENKEFILPFLQNSDFNISEISFRKQNMPLPQILSPKDEIEPIRPDKDVSVLIGLRDTEIIKPEFTHFYMNKEKKTENGVLPAEAESSGTIRTFGLAAPFHKALSENGLLMIDEIETSLHPRIVEYLMLVFLVNSKEAQLVFTTHNISLMKSEFMRPDVIWFTEKDETGATELYPLAGFSGVKMAKVREQYEAGKFGAYPHVWNYRLNVIFQKEREK